MTQAINKKSKEGNVILKVDLAKAYDQVDWNFLRLVLQSFGFSSKVCSLLSECVETPDSLLR